MTQEATIPPAPTLRDHLRIAELTPEQQAVEQRRLARIRAIRRALDRTPHGDPRKGGY